MSLLNHGPSPVADPKMLDSLPYFHAVPLLEWAKAQPELRAFPAKASVFQREEAASHAVFLVEGTMQITNIDENGRESLAVRLSAGDVCAMMVLSGLSERDYPGTITAETDATALFVAKGSFLSWMYAYAPVRNAVFGNIMDGLIQLGSNHSPGKMSLPLEARLAKALLHHTSEQEPTTRITHQQLAAELGSVREVVSRALGRMQRRGWIGTGRGSVSVLRRDVLEELLGD